MAPHCLSAEQKHGSGPSTWHLAGTPDSVTTAVLVLTSSLALLLICKMGILVDSFGLKIMKMLQVKVHTQYKNYFRDLSGGSVVKNPPSKARSVSSIPGYRVKPNSKHTNKQTKNFTDAQ